MLSPVSPQEMQRRFDETRQRLQRKISRFPGELVVALSRAYDGKSFTSHGPIDSYAVEIELEVGTISDKTVFGDLPKPEMQIGRLISGLQNAFYLTTKGFAKKEPSVFDGTMHKGLLLIAEMDEPPELPEIDWRQYRKPGEIHIVAPRGPMIHETKDSRLELYIGDSMAVPYLRGSLDKEQLEQLSKLLQKDITR